MTGKTMGDYRAIFAERRLGLAFGPANEPMRSALETFDLRRDFGVTIKDGEAARAALAGLWLYHDFESESHAISQDLNTPEGSYWHAILHRREPDAGNAKYWFHRVGRHTIFPRLAEEAATIEGVQSGRGWDPFAFVDRCERHRGSGDANERILEHIQLAEWRLLFDWCRQLAALSR